jgi:hypothetical protein
MGNFSFFDKSQCKGCEALSELGISATIGGKAVLRIIFILIVVELETF